MSFEGQINTGKIGPFLGQNSTAPKNLLPLEISPDAEGIDFRDGTIRKRKGYARLHQNRIVGGGVLIDNDVVGAARNGAIVIPQDASYWTAQWQCELYVKITSMSDAAPDLELATCHDGTLGWALNVRFDSGGGTWHFDFLSELTGPVTKDISVTLTGDPTNQKYQIWFGRDGTNMYLRVVDSAGDVLSATTAHSAATLLAPTRDTYIGAASGATPGTQNIALIVDEFVVWKKGSAAAFAPDRFFREMTVAEKSDADLDGYWQMNDVALNNTTVIDSEGGNNGVFIGNGTVPDSIQVSSLVPLASSSDGASRFNGVDNLYFAYHNENVARFADVTRQDDFTLEFWVERKGAAVDDDTLIQIGSRTKPLCTVKMLGTSGHIEVDYFRDGQALGGINFAYILVLDTPTHLSIRFDVSTGVKLYVNGVLHNSVSITGPDNPGYVATLGDHNGIYIGGSYQESGDTFERFAPVIIDEVRLWAVDLGLVSKGVIWNAEVDPDDADLLWYFRLNAVSIRRDEILNLTGVGSNLIGRNDTIPAAQKPRWSEGLVDGTGTLDKIYGLGAFENPDIDNELLAMSSSDYWRMKNGVVARVDTMLVANTKPWSTIQYRDNAILCNEHEGVRKYDGTRISPITPDAPDESGVGAALTAGDITGVVSYKLVFKNAGDAAQSPPSGIITPTTPSTQQVDFTSLPVSSDPQVSILEIWRTNIAATDARYFYLTEVLNGVTTYTDNDDTASLAGLPLTDTLGQPPLARYVAIHQERIFVAEGSQLFFSEVTSNDNPGGFAQFDSRNVIDIELDDGHEITGFISTKTGILVSKSNGLYQVFGAGTYAVERFSDAEGFISHNSIAVSAGYVYGVRRTDVARIPLPLGQFGRSSAQDVEPISESNREVFEGLADADWQNAVGVFDVARSEYRLSLVSSSEHIEMVYNELTGIWSKRALPIDGYVKMALTTTAVRSLAAIGGYIVELERNDNDGGEVDGTTYTLTGTATGGSVDKLTDTGLDDYYGSRFAGLKIMVEDTTGDLTLQERFIYSDYQDDLYVSVPFTRAPASGDRYWIAPIDSFWNSAPYTFPREGSDFVGNHRVHRLRVLNIDKTGTVVQLTHAMDGATADSVDLTLDERAQDYAIRQIGEEFTFGFRNRFPDEPFDIEALSLIYTEAKKR